MKTTTETTYTQSETRFENRIYQFISGHSSLHDELEQRLFSTVMFLCALGGFSTFIANFFLNLNITLQFTTFLTGIVFTIFWLFARRGTSSLKLVYPATVALFLLLSTEWIHNAGSRGGVHPFMLAAPLVFTVFSRGTGRIIILITYFLMVISLLLTEHYFPHLIVEFSSQSDQLIDTIIAFSLCTILSVAFVLAIHNGYRSAVQKADTEKHASETRFYETADILPVGICETDYHLVISFLNREGYELTKIKLRLSLIPDLPCSTCCILMTERTPEMPFPKFSQETTCPFMNIA